MSSRHTYTVPLAHGGVLHLGDRVLVMGILNITPDSFGNIPYANAQQAIDAGLRMLDEGADLLDIGGESTRPGAAPVDVDEEIRRALPVVEGLARHARVPISIDTYKPAVARRALDAGAALVNDISGLQYEPELAGVVAASDAALVLMHTRGRSARMYAEAGYGDVATEVVKELEAAVRRATDAGVTRERLILDPGIGFAKRAEHSYGVLARLQEIVAALGRPVLVGPSRKSFMSAALGGRPPLERDWGTAAAVTTSVLAGAHIVRVHAVREMAQVVRVAEEIRRNA